MTGNQGFFWLSEIRTCARLIFILDGKFDALNRTATPNLRNPFVLHVDFDIFYYSTSPIPRVLSQRFSNLKIGWHSLHQFSMRSN